MRKRTLIVVALAMLIQLIQVCPAVSEIETSNHARNGPSFYVKGPGSSSSCPTVMTLTHGVISNGVNLLVLRHFTMSKCVQARHKFLASMCAFTSETVKTDTMLAAP